MPSDLRHLRPLLLLLLLLLVGCNSGMKTTPSWLVQEGRFGQARQQVRDNLEPNRSERSYLLDRMRLAILTLADGYPQGAQTTLEDIYELLRTQGINRDKTVASVVINENVRFWKGEPFEQAMMLFYYGAQQASLGSWDNARAAADNSLFKLRDFSGGKKEQRINTLDIAQRAMEVERGGDPNAGEKYLNSGYAVRDSNFTLGYLLAAIANQQLQREQEASDFYTVAGQTNPSIVPMLEQFRGGRYNTVLVVSYGLGPRKSAYGPDNALAEFVPRYRSDNRRLIVRQDQRVATYPLVTDLNSMAMDHMWNNMEDVRVAKSTLGTGLLLGGAAATGYGLYADNEVAALAGLGAMALGLLAKAGAQADTRYCDVMPQRVYVVPLQLEGDGPIELQLENEHGTRLVLTGLTPPRGTEAQLRYVRLVSPPPEMRTGPPMWATSGRVFYANAYSGPLPEANVPYILGGRCVMPPSQTALASYQRVGGFAGMTVAELEQLYREEKIAWTYEDQSGMVGLHVLEGGRSLVSPLPGTTGYARLFGQTWPAYQPRSQFVRNLMQNRPNPDTQTSSR